MGELIANESPRRGIVRKASAVVMAVAVVLMLGACRATGGGRIDDPLPSGALPTGDIVGAFAGEANFGFNFTCEMKSKKRAVINGQITYHDTGYRPVGSATLMPIRLHGTVDPFFTTAANCKQAAMMFVDAAQFEGTYRSQEASLASAPPGRFTVLVFDQGEPGRTKDPAFVTGDAFSIELVGGPYAAYTRAGYIEGGNIQVNNR